MLIHLTSPHRAWCKCLLPKGGNAGCASVQCRQHVTTYVKLSLETNHEMRRVGIICHLLGQGANLSFSGTQPYVPHSMIRQASVDPQQPKTIALNHTLPTIADGSSSEEDGRRGSRAKGKNLMVPNMS